MNAAQRFERLKPDSEREQLLNSLCSQVSVASPYQCTVYI